MALNGLLYFVFRCQLAGGMKMMTTTMMLDIDSRNAML